MKENVVYFYKLFGQSAKKRFWEKPFILQEAFPLTENMNLLRIGIPEYYHKKKKWKKEKLNKELEKRLSLISANIVYRVTDNRCQDLLTFKKESLPWELFEYILDQIDGVEGLLILEGEDSNTSYIVEKYAPRLNFLGIQTEKEYEQLEGQLFEEYGLNMHLGPDAVKFFIPPMKRLLVIDMGAAAQKILKRLPENTIYLDVQSDEMKKMRILAKRNDIQYIAVLDTIRKNRYNTEVN